MLSDIILLWILVSMLILSFAFIFHQALCEK